MIKKFFKDITGATAREAKQKRMQLEEEIKQTKARIRKEKAEKRRIEKFQQETKKLTEKETATKNGEPWVDVISVEVDYNNPDQGALEFDWNDIFIARLIKAGYPGKTDADIVDNWFRTVCQNVALELFEQEQADPEKRSVTKRKLDNCRTEVS